MRFRVNIVKKIIKASKSIKLPHNLLNRLFAVTLIMSSSLLILLSVSWLNNRAYGLRPDNQFQDNILTIEAPNVVDVSRPELVNAEYCASCADVIIEMQHYSPIERQLTGVVHIKIPDSVKENLWDSNGYISTIDNDHPNALILRSTYENSEITLITFSSFLSNVESEIKVPLGEFYTDYAESPITVPFTINFSGESSTYPGDWYYAENYFSLSLPDPIWLRDNDAGFNATIPINLYISSSFQMRDFNAIIKRGIKNNDIPSFLLKILIVRDGTTKYYIYAMAFLPILLSLVFAHSNFVIQKNKEKVVGNIILEVAAIMFSVLPLRSVLVPSNLDGLVSVDLILGLGIALMVFFALIIYAQEVWKIK